MKNIFAPIISESNDRMMLIEHTLKWLVIIPLIIGFVTRVVLLLNPQTQISFSFFEWMNIFFFGLVNDLAVAFVSTLFVYICVISFSDRKYVRPWGYIIMSVFLLLFLYVTCFHTIFDEYGSVVPKLVQLVLLYKLVSFGIRLFFRRIRRDWSFVVYTIILFITMFLMLVNAAGEYFFWSEFGVRYNFIAVDYLIYTNEVVGNILESYPIFPLLSALIIVSGAFTWLIVRGTYKLFGAYPFFSRKCSISILYTGVFLVALLHLSMTPRFENSPNTFVNELQANGLNKLYRAFWDNKLDYKDFYARLPEKEVVDIINRQYSSMGSNNKQTITATASEIHKNIVLIMEESMSGSYLARYGNTDRMTPNLDRLMNEGLAFDSLFATGNRTVRGLEAVTLCRPPSPGESIIKQKDNANFFSVGTVLRSKGYATQFLYGGDAYFDNMSTFYRGNGYQVIDKKDFDPQKIHFSNIWGVCDEDIFSKAIEVMNENATKGKPALLHIMTVSNHRPYTYPDGRIDIPSNAKSRKGGVKYADYAIGKFIADASKESWFKNTVFIIVADHCASSAGKMEIPLDKYQIPALIYAPGFIHPQSYKKISSQIDIMPTIFGLLNFNYVSYFYGHNVLAPTYQPRAMMATYQDLGYFEENRLVVLSTGRKVDQFIVRPQNHLFTEILAGSNYTPVTLRAIANYQSASSKR